jgi:hypothetical protein
MRVSGDSDDEKHLSYLVSEVVFWMASRELKEKRLFLFYNKLKAQPSIKMFRYLPSPSLSLPRGRARITTTLYRLDGRRCLRSYHALTVLHKSTSLLHRALPPQSASFWTALLAGAYDDLTKLGFQAVRVVGVSHPSLSFGKLF